MVVHGIPGAYEVAEGDLISVDVGVTLDGFVADSAYTFPVGDVIERGAAAARRRPATRSPPGSSRRGRATASATSRHAVQQHVEGAGFSVVRSLVGHGVGRS